MNTKSIYTVFLSVIISAGVSAQKVEWKYSTQDNYWKNGKGIKWSDSPEKTGEVIRISDEKKPNISMVWAVLSTNSDGTLYVLLPEEKKNEILF